MSRPQLIQRIRSAIQEEGRISFARFMEMALYDPEEGYYASGQNIGFQGDYYTSPHLHPLFGRMVAKQLLEMLRRLGEEPWTLVELGAGKGLLAYDILGYLHEKEPDRMGRLRYLLLERSEAMRRLQRERLHPWRERVEWLDSLEALGDQVEGCVFSNEFFDALPVHRLLLHGDRVQEIYLTDAGGDWEEILDEPSSENLRRYVGSLAFQPSRPTQIEVNPAAMDWMGEIGRRLGRGFVLTIDYGHLARDLYSVRRPRGTLLCYYRHAVNEKFYERIGEQDITAHVNFTDLIRAGRRVGLTPEGLTDQMHFLMGLGIDQAMEEMAADTGIGPDREAELSALKQLMHPSGMGKVFKVLIQSKGVEGPALSGLTFKAFFENTQGDGLISGEIA